MSVFENILKGAYVSRYIDKSLGNISHFRISENSYIHQVASATCQYPKSLTLNF